MHGRHVSTYHLFWASTSGDYRPTMSTSCLACQWVSCGRPMLLRRRFLCHRTLGDVSDALTPQFCRALSQSLSCLHHQQRPVGRCRCQGIALFRVHTGRSLVHRQRSQRHPWTKGVRACGLMRSSVLPSASCFMAGGTSRGCWCRSVSRGAKGQMVCKHGFGCWNVSRQRC